MRRVVVTGLGLVTPGGNTVEESWRSVLSGKSAISTITGYDASSDPVQIAGEVKGFDPLHYLSAKEVGRTSRFVQFAVAASKQAIEQAGAREDFAAERSGVSIGVGLGAIRDIEINTMTLKEKGHRRISPFFIPYSIPNMAAGEVSIQLGFQGPNMCTTTACASGTHAIGEAFHYIQSNRADVMICGGAESTISPLGVASFNALKALSKRNDDPLQASRPFDLHRDGFVMGEGAGVMVLEELEHAKKRGAPIICEMIGFGLSGDGYHITAPPPGHDGGRRCMEMALREANCPLEHLDYINAHGTSTKLNDQYESMAIAALLGPLAKKVAISSTKGVIGHCLGAAGGIEAVFTALAIANSQIPPTANLTDPDPDCPLDYVPLEAREQRVRVAMSNSFGFGGTNAAIVMGRFEG